MITSRIDQLPVRGTISEFGYLVATVIMKSLRLTLLTNKIGELQRVLQFN